MPPTPNPSPSVRGETGGQGFQLVFGASRQDQLRSEGSKLFGQSFTDTAGRSGDQDTSPLQVTSHRMPLRSETRVLIIGKDINFPYYPILPKLQILPSASFRKS